MRGRQYQKCTVHHLRPKKDIVLYPIDQVCCIMGDDILCSFDCLNDSQDFVLESEKRVKRRRGLVSSLRLNFRLTWTGWHTGRSEAVLSKYLMLWFNALFKRTERAQISIENVSRCGLISHHYGTGDWTQTELVLEVILEACRRGLYNHINMK